MLVVMGTPWLLKLEEPILKYHPKGGYRAIRCQFASTELRVPSNAGGPRPSRIRKGAPSTRLSIYLCIASFSVLATRYPVLDSVLVDRRGGLQVD